MDAGLAERAGTRLGMTTARSSCGSHVSDGIRANADITDCRKLCVGRSTGAAALFRLHNEPDDVLG